MTLHYIAPQDRERMTAAKAARVFLANNGVCHICGVQLRPGDKWDVEHVVALADGGSSAETNLRIAHVKCHAAKTATESGQRAKRTRIITASYAGKPKGRPIPGSKASGWRKRMDGTVERR